MSLERDDRPRGPKNAPEVTRAVGAELLSAGKTVAEIATELGVVKSTVCYHARRLGQPADERFARRYDWEAIQRFYDEGHSIRACARKFGFCTESWHRAVRAGLFASRPAAAPIERYLVVGRRTNRSHLAHAGHAPPRRRARCQGARGPGRVLIEPRAAVLRITRGEPAPPTRDRPGRTR